MEWQSIPYMILLSMSGMGTAALALYVWWRRWDLHQMEICEKRLSEEFELLK